MFVHPSMCPAEATSSLFRNGSYNTKPKRTWIEKSVDINIFKKSDE